MRSNLYQYALIALGVAATVLFGVFLQREIFPEYKIYQNDYVALEAFRSTYTGEAPPDFKFGVKQIVQERTDKGPAEIDRCISCHVALQFPHFSPTKIARDVNGEILRDSNGIPVQVENPDDVWAKLDEAIIALRKVGKNSEADRYEALKTAKVGEHEYDVTKVLRMHPLMGRETRPFEYHPIEEYGCTTCHNGNGRALTTNKAHGPVFDGQYEEEFMGPEPAFIESDPLNDPSFAYVFNHKPGSELIFQTSPLFVGPLIQAKCLNCHQNSAQELYGIAATANNVVKRREKRSAAVKSALDNEKSAVAALLQLQAAITKNGMQKTMDELKIQSQNYALPTDELERMQSQIRFLESEKDPLATIQKQLVTSVGSTELAKKLQNSPSVDAFLKESASDPNAIGSLFKKAAAINLEEALLKHAQDSDTSWQKSLTDQNVISSVVSDIDLLTQNYQRGQELYISNACYACHRIAGFSRGGVGPEHTLAGNNYPWFLKESIVWPQADLVTSTMPNYHMDHDELQDVMTFLLAQTGENRSVSDTAYKVAIQEWEAGKKLPWEKAITPDQIHNLRYSMTVFATEGCAACHRLRGFESNVGFAKEKDKATFDELYDEKEWFRKLFPESMLGSDIVRVIEQNKEEIDRRIVSNVRKDSIIEEIDELIPGQVEGLYTPFKYAARAKNYFYRQAAAEEKDPAKKEALLNELAQWKDRVHRVLMMFVQEYGLGRLIAPRPNWAGVYRSDEWLMEHFKNPAAHVPRSIMPVFPFDESKFYALTYMLDVLGKQNRDYDRQVWNTKGFSPERAYEIYCAQCHGDFMQGNGPVATWIYPIPKNLRNADFLRNLTEERVIYSIVHGVKGTPMPPWGEVGSDKPMMDNIPVLTKDEAQQFADWMFSFVPGGTVIKAPTDVPKWQYTPDDVIKELKNEGNELKGAPESALNKKMRQTPVVLSASLEPVATIDDTNPIFDVVQNPVSTPDKNAYYIKKRYYTEENIDKGRAFFEMNCAVCHGKEGDGTGTRSGEMKDAKPRMLTNLDWSNMRDDLRLLRSIKYGVPGTSMSAWGDLTTSLQRLQLVIFIRTLTQENRSREDLNAALYQVYDNELLAVEQARIQAYPALAKMQLEYDQQQLKRKQLYEADSKETVAAYQAELSTYESLKKLQEKDTRLADLRKSIAQEKEVYFGVGMQLLKVGTDSDLNTYLALIKLNGGRYKYADDKLNADFSETTEKAIKADGGRIISSMETRIKQLEDHRVVIEGRFPSQQQKQELIELQNDISSLTKVKQRLISGLEEAVRLRKQQEILYKATLPTSDQGKREQ